MQIQPETKKHNRIKYKLFGSLVEQRNEEEEVVLDVSKLL